MATDIARLVAFVIVPDFIKMNGHRRTPAPDRKSIAHGRMFATKPPTFFISVCTNDSGASLPVHALTISHHVLKLLLAGVLHHDHGADPENVCEPVEHDAVRRGVVSP